MGAPAGNADFINIGTNHLPAIGNQHDLITGRHRERGHHGAVTLGNIDICNPLATAPGPAIFMCRSAFAHAFFGDRQDEFFNGAKFGETILAEHDFRWLDIGVINRVFGCPPEMRRLPQINVSLTHIGAGNILILHVTEHGHGHNFVTGLQANAAHPHGIAATENPHIGNMESDGFAGARCQQDIIGIGAWQDADQAITGIELHGNFTIPFDVGEIGHSVAAHGACRGRKHDLQFRPLLFIIGQRHHGLDPLALFQRQQIHHGLAARLGRGQRQTINFHLIDHATRGEKQQRRMGIGHKQPADRILVPRCHAGTALAAATLRPIGG